MALQVYKPVKCLLIVCSCMYVHALEHACTVTRTIKRKTLEAQNRWCSVTTATDGEEALATLEAGNGVDLVLADIMKPKENCPPPKVACPPHA